MKPPSAARLISSDPDVHSTSSAVSAYLPCEEGGGVWFPWSFAVDALDSLEGEAMEGCQWVTLAAPLDRVPLLIRGGHVLPMQVGFVFPKARTLLYSVH